MLTALGEEGGGGGENLTHTHIHTHTLTHRDTHGGAESNVIYNYGGRGGGKGCAEIIEKES